MSAPTPAEVDIKAAAYNRLQDQLEAATNAAKKACIPLAALKLQLIDLVSSYGGPHAQKSKILHGVTTEMVATFGQAFTIDAAAVERFRQALIEENYTRLHKKIFEQSVRFTLAPEASAIIRGLELPKKLLALYSVCQVVKDKAPSFVVREKSANSA